MPVRIGEIGAGGQGAVVAGAWSRGDAARVERAGVKTVEVNSATGFEGRDLEFLAEIPWIEELHVVDDSLENVEGIRYLPRLQRLNLSSSAATRFDFGSLADLRELFALWGPGRDSIFGCLTLTDLYVTGYRGVDLAPMRELCALERLRVGDARRLTSLDGLPSALTLRSLGIFLAPRLVDWGAVTGGDELVELDIQTCKRLGGVAIIAGLRQLKRLSVNNCGPIDSIRPLAGLANLETFFFYESTSSTATSPFSSRFLRWPTSRSKIAATIPTLASNCDACLSPAQPRPSGALRRELGSLPQRF